MFDLWKSPEVKLDVPKIIDTIEGRIYADLKPLGFRKHGRSLHRFVDGDISQVIGFQCGQAWRNETHVLAVNVGIRVPECMLRAFHSDEVLKKFYQEHHCNMRSSLGEVKGEKIALYDLKGDIEPIIRDISEQIDRYVIPAFDALISREAILKERRNYPNLDTLNSHLILLEEAMIYGRMGDRKKAEELFFQYFRQCREKEEPNIYHIKYLEELAEALGIALEH